MRYVWENIVEEKHAFDVQ